MSKEDHQEVTDFFDRLAAHLTNLSGMLRKLDDVGWPSPPQVGPDVVRGQSLDQLCQSMDDLARLSTELATSEASVLVSSTAKNHVLQTLKLEVTRSILQGDIAEDRRWVAGAVEFFAPPPD